MRTETATIDKSPGEFNDLLVDGGLHLEAGTEKIARGMNIVMGGSGGITLAMRGWSSWRRHRSRNHFALASPGRFH